MAMQLECGAADGEAVVTGYVEPPVPLLDEGAAAGAEVSDDGPPTMAAPGFVADSCLAETDLVSQQHLADLNEGDATVALCSVEALAEVTAGHLQAGRVPEAVSVLQHALEAYNVDALSHGETPPSMMACSGMHLLLCAVLSRGGCHDLAYQEAQEAASKMDEVWGQHLLGPSGSDAARAEALRGFLSTPPSWLVRAVELAVQARQCAATELEFMKDWELEEEGCCSEQQSALLYARLWEQIAQLHTEATQLARQLLDESHPVRESTERALHSWLSRGPDGYKHSQEFPASPTRCQTPVLAGMLAGQCGPATMEDIPTAQDRDRGWRTLAPARSLPSLLKGSNAQLPRRRAQASVDSVLGGSCELSCSMRSAPSSSKLSQKQPSIMSNKSDSWLRGPAKEMMQTSPSWGANRRCPIFSTMSGTGGKAEWALRGGQRHTRTGAGKEVLDPFQDWLLAAQGSATSQKSLGARVVEDEESMGKFNGELREKSRLFKNFWLKDEVKPEHLYEDRIRFTDHGMRTFNRSSQKYPKADPRSSWPQIPSHAASIPVLFNHYGIQQTKKEAEAEPSLKHLGALLHKSQDSLQRIQAKTARRETPNHRR